MKIGWHSWEPGLTSPRASAAGGGEWTRLLFRDFVANGHDIVWCGYGPNPTGTSQFSEFNIPDVTFFYWRWDMNDVTKVERQEAYYSQMRLLETLASAKRRVVIFDGDHKITVDNYREINAMFGNLVTWAAPELNPKEGFIQLFYPFKFDLKRQIAKVPLGSRWGVTYVGNVYERYEQAVEMLSEVSMNFEVSMYGDWLTGGVGRPSPNIVRASLPFVSFFDRIRADRVIDTLARADSTVHLFKPSYANVGFMTYRWAEAIQARTPAFIPSSFYLPEEWQTALRPMIVDSGNALMNKYADMSEFFWKTSLEAQTAFVMERSKTQPWLELVNGTE